MNNRQKVTLAVTLAVCSSFCVLPPAIEERVDFAGPNPPIVLRSHSALTCPFDRDKEHQTARNYSRHVVDWPSLAARLGAVLFAGLALTVTLGLTSASAPAPWRR